MSLSDTTRHDAAPGEDAAWRLTNTRAGWGLVHRALHWGIAGLIAFQLGLGLWMANAVDDLYARFDYTQVHKSFGFVVFALALARIGWRLANPVPRPPAMPRWQARASATSHLALYALTTLLPVSGWLMASASPLQDLYGIENRVFGLFALPDPFVPGSDALDRVLKAVHFWSAMGLVAILGVHIAAALKHQFVDRDGLLKRMIAGRG
ncbi:MAG: cytochrome b [Paracoccaceae bacterium]